MAYFTRKSSAYDAYRPFALASGAGRSGHRFLSDVGTPPTPKQPYIDTGENPEAQGASGGMTAPDMAIANLKANAFIAENQFGIQRIPVQPGLPLPQRSFVVPGTGTQPVAVDPFGTPLQSPAQTREPGQQAFTNAPTGPPKTIASWVNAAGNPATQTTIDVAYQGYLDSPSAGDTPLSKDAWAKRKGYTVQTIENPDYKKAYDAFTTNEERALLEQGKLPAALTKPKKQEKPARATTTLEDPAAHGYQGWPSGYAVKVARDEKGNVLRVSEPTRPPTDYLAEAAKAEADKRKRLGKQENRDAYKVAVQNYKQAVALQKKETKRQAGIGAQRAFVASTGFDPMRAVGTGGFAQSRGFNPTAPAGSTANPYGTQGPSVSPVQTFNEANARRETARLQNAGLMGQAVSKVLSDAKTGALSQTSPVVRQSLLATLIRAQADGQTDSEGSPLDFSGAIAALRGADAQVQARGVASPYVRFAGKI